MGRFIAIMLFRLLVVGGVVAVGALGGWMIYALATAPLWVVAVVGSALTLSFAAGRAT